MEKSETFHTLSYQILNLLERDLLDVVLKGDTFLVKENQIKIISKSSDAYKKLNQLLDKCLKMGLEISYGPTMISIKLPSIKDQKGWELITDLGKSVLQSNLGQLINHPEISDILIEDMYKNKLNWEFDGDFNLINKIKKIMISFRLSGSGIVFMRMPLLSGGEIISDYFELSPEESLKLMSFVDSHFSFDFSQDQTHLNRIKNLKRTLE